MYHDIWKKMPTHFNIPQVDREQFYPGDYSMNFATKMQHFKKTNKELLVLTP